MKKEKEFPEYYVNTDSIDIENKQIGIHASQCYKREFCIGINHLGNKESVHEATRIAKLISKAPEMYKLIKKLSLLPSHPDALDDIQIEADDLLKQVEEEKKKSNNKYEQLLNEAVKSQKTINQLRYDYIQTVLKKFNNDKVDAAKYLGITIKSLYNLLDGGQICNEDLYE